MIATLLTAYINILKAVVSLMTTSAQSVFQAVKPAITIPLGENLMEQVSNNSEALINTVDYYQGRIVNLLQKLEDKVKNDMTMNSSDTASRLLTTERIIINSFFLESGFGFL
jgi:hypothetical protein